MGRLLLAFVAALKAGGVLLFLLAIGTTAWARHPAPSIDGPFGGVVPSDEEFATYPKTLPPGAFAARQGAPPPPSHFAIPHKALPPVQAQGTQESLGSPGSCGVWPYEPSCSYLGSIDTEQACDTNPAFCTHLAIGSWSALGTHDGSEALPLIKGYVAQSRIVQVSIVVPWEFVAYRHGVYDAPSACPASTPKCAQYGSIACIAEASLPSGCAQHGVVIVG